RRSQDLCRPDKNCPSPLPLSPPLIPAALATPHPCRSRHPSLLPLSPPLTPDPSPTGRGEKEGSGEVERHPSPLPLSRWERGNEIWRKVGAVPVCLPLGGIY